MKAILDKLNGISVNQASELLNLNVNQVLQLVANGILEKISFGSQSVDGVTYESVSSYIRQQAEKEIFQKKSIERAHKSWNVFKEFFLNTDGEVSFNKLYGIYDTWTKREGLLTLGKVELGEYLVSLCGFGERFENAQRVIVGISLKANSSQSTQMKIVTSDDIFTQKLMEYIQSVHSYSGPFKNLAQNLKTTPRKLRGQLLKSSKILKENGYEVVFMGRDNQGAKLEIKPKEQESEA